MPNQDIASMLSLALPEMEGVARSGTSDLLHWLKPTEHAVFADAMELNMLGAATQIAEFANELGSRFPGVKKLTLRYPANSPQGYIDFSVPVSAYD